MRIFEAFSGSGALAYGFVAIYQEQPGAMLRRLRIEHRVDRGGR